MRQITLRLFIALSMVLMVACATSDNTLREQGHNESYLQGFHDGRHSGMKEAGNNWEHYVKDHERFASDNDYRDGWIEGEAEGKHLQEQAKAIGGSYTGYQIGTTSDFKSINSQVGILTGDGLCHCPGADDCAFIGIQSKAV